MFKLYFSKPNKSYPNKQEINDSALFYRTGSKDLNYHYKTCKSISNYSRSVVCKLIETHNKNLCEKKKNKNPELVIYIPPLEKRTILLSGGKTL